MTRSPNANATQRMRRGRHVRIDYYPSPEALEAIRGAQAAASAALDAVASRTIDRLVIEAAKREAP